MQANVSSNHQATYYTGPGLALQAELNIGEGVNRLHISGHSRLSPQKQWAEGPKEENEHRRALVVGQSSDQTNANGITFDSSCRPYYREDELFLEESDDESEEIRRGV
jgi:hypothetical protein